MHVLVADLNGRFFFDQCIGDALFNRFEIKRAKTGGEISAHIAKLGCGVQKANHHFRRLGGHMFGCQFMSDDLRIGAAAIAVTMVAIMVCVDDGIDRLRRCFRIAIGGQHGLGKRDIKQRVDQ